MARPVVALLTDFGTRDHYVGTMKGVVLSVCADATLVDLTHEIAPQDVVGAALELEAAYRYFPAGTVFLVVVDPGVGTSRRALAAEADGYFFVAPDNGVLSVILSAVAEARVVELRERRYTRSTISRTFEGRDRFAPAAGWLARQTDLAKFGPALSDFQRITIPESRITDEGIDGEVIRVDRFGNLITNISRRSIEQQAGSGVVEIAQCELQLRATYSEVAPGELCALLSSSNQVEIALNGGSAAQRLGLGRGARVRYHFRLR